MDYTFRLSKFELEEAVKRYIQSEHPELKLTIRKVEFQADTTLVHAEKYVQRTFQGRD